MKIKKLIIVSLITAALMVSKSNMVFASNSDSNLIRETITEEITQPQTVSNKYKDTALTPVGVAIGAMIAPVWLGAEYTKDALVWSNENIVSPVANGIGYGIYYTLDTASNVSDWVGNNIMQPVLETTVDAMVSGGKYTIVPLAKGLYWGLCKTVDGAEFASQYTIVPLGNGISWTADKTTEAIGYGVELGYEYVAVPLGNGVMFGAQYTVIPVAKGLKWSAEKIGDGLDIGVYYILVPIGNGARWSSDNIILPVAKGVHDGIKSTVVSVGNAVKSNKNKINEFVHGNNKQQKEE